ncbi:Scr1 family TA system antitoxin-like transcriptional regulator [Streptomyces sp. DSM 118878]
MPARKVITARHMRLATELRKLRERAGLSVREAAHLLGIAPPKLSNTEAAQVGVSPERVRHFASQYACEDTALVDALAAMAGERVRGWWEDYREAVPTGYLDLAELEANATRLWTFQTVHVPALLQTENQVRAVFTSTVPRLSREQLDIRLRFRLRRQGLLDRPGGFDYVAVIHEAALRIRAADSLVARSQLQHILEQAERPHVTVRVVPFDVDGFAALGHPLLYTGGPVPQLDTVLMDTPHGGAFLDGEAQLSRYREVMHKVEGAALGVLESRNLIDRIRQSM